MATTKIISEGSQFAGLGFHWPNRCHSYQSFDMMLMARWDHTATVPSWPAFQSSLILSYGLYHYVNHAQSCDPHHSRSSWDHSVNEVVWSFEFWLLPLESEGVTAKRKFCTTVVSFLKPSETIILYLFMEIIEYAWVRYRTKQSQYIESAVIFNGATIKATRMA